jgi:hypothetical protein
LDRARGDRPTLHARPAGDRAKYADAHALCFVAGMGKERAGRLPESLAVQLPRLYDSTEDFEEECAEPTRDGALDRSAVEAILRGAEAQESWFGRPQVRQRRTTARMGTGERANGLSSGVHVIDDAARIADAIAEMAEPLDSEHAARGRERSVVLSADELVDEEPAIESGISDVRDTLLDEAEVECLFDAPPPSVEPDDDLERTLAVAIQQRLIGIPFPADPGELQPVVPLARCRVPKVRVPPPPIAITPPAVAPAPIPLERASTPRLVLTLLALAFSASLVAGYLTGWIAP